MATTAAAPHFQAYDVPPALYGIVVLVLVFYAAVEYFRTKQDHEVRFPEAIRWSVCYLFLALFFTIPVYVLLGSQAAGEYVAAWAIEKMLSLDNLFVFSLIFASFQVPKRLERRILNYGIAGAIVFRLLFIIAGIELLRRFQWIAFIFGVLLLRAAWSSFRTEKGQGEQKPHKSLAWKLVSRVLPIHPEYIGNKLFVRRKGRLMLTMMAAVIIMIELTDIAFAVDSVPAVLAVSRDPFIAYSSNVFAIIGLRALYFVYSSASTVLWGLNRVLSLVLLWVAIKMVLLPFGIHVPIVISLSVIGSLLATGIGISLLYPKYQPIANTEV
jgi:tellurite resistance protein TerC